ncbi:MAG TPA: hypothetical protein VFQ77_10305 [Pseudonocardiaceae bacterium]|nr:hypothetical protein [Pseudonocardiaceae bacterium]
MKLTILGVASNNGGSPTLLGTDRDTYLVQGWKVLDAETLAQLNLPEHETVVEVPKALFRFLPPGGASG